MKTSVSVSHTDVTLSMIMFREDLASAFKKVSDIGYQGVELFLPSAEGVDVAHLKELLSRNNLQVGMLAAMADLVGEGITLGNPDAAVRKAFIQKAPSHLELAAELGALIPIGFTRGSVQPGTTAEDVDGWLMESLETYGRMAGDLGVTLILEPINRHEINYINRVEEALKIIDAMNLSNLKLLLDAYHLNIEEVSIPMSIFEAREHIGHFHFVDSNRWPPGYGHTDMKEIYFCLEKIGYNGFYAVEALPKPDPMTGAQRGLEYLRMLERLWNETNGK